MNILITGGLGGVGRPLVQQLLSHGHAVRIFDRNAAASADPSTAVDAAEHMSGDVTDFTALRKAVRGMHAVIHLAALTHPAAGPGHEIFRVNAAGTFNVYEAAAQEGIRRVVCASSINALGFNFGVKPFPIEFLPIDEAHPTFTTDAYSFSKAVVEDIGAYYYRRDGITGAQLRLPWVYGGMSGMRDVFEAMFSRSQQAFAAFMALPEDEQRARVRAAIAENDAARARRIAEQPWEERAGDRSMDDFDPLALMIGGYTDFWAVIGGEDAAQAFEKSVTAEYDGSHALFACEARNSLGIESQRLARMFFPEARLTRPLIGDESLVSFAKARQLIGFEPRGHILEWFRST